MARVTRRMRKIRDLNLYAPAVEYVSALESSGVLAAAIESSGQPNGGVIGFEESDVALLESWGCDHPVREVARVLSVTDSQVWRPVSETEDKRDLPVKCSEFPAKLDENGEKIRNSKGKIVRVKRSAKYCGIGRSRTVSDDRGNAIKTEKQ